jgi:hypothetical protein
VSPLMRRRIVSWLCVLGACSGGNSTTTTTSGSGSGTADHAAAFRDDLHALEAELAHHKNQFFHLDSATWHRAARALEAQLATIDDDHAVAALFRLTAMLGDSHTTLSPPRGKLYPVRFLSFEDGLFVAGTAPDQRWAIGKRVVAIDKRPIADVLAALTPFVSSDNAVHLARVLPSYLENPVLMAGADVTRGDRMTVTVADGSATRDLELVAGNGVQLELFLPKVKPLHLQGPIQLAYWNTYVDEQHLLYFQYNSCENDPREQPFARFAAGTFAFVDHHRVDAFVIDLRSNDGGASGIIEPLVEGLVQRKLHVFALIGRETFSSGLLAAVELSARANAKLIGTQTGGNPNSYGDVQRFALPRSHLTGQYSTKWFADPVHTGTTLEPDVLVHVASDDWFSGRDPAMDAVLAP